jgi:hypothetical protein
MLSQNREYQSLEVKEAVVPVASVAHTEDTLEQASGRTPTKFYGRYHDSMELYASASLVGEYLNAHSSWFSRCAEPMKVQPLGENGYALGIGRFGSFGYEVEPKVGLELLPPVDGIYRIHTIPIPGYYPPGYDVDYNASMRMIEDVANDAPTSTNEITRVEWELDLIVDIHFPKFIQRLPKSLVQSTGDRLLNQIVRQVSKRLTHKVSQDFHQSLGIDFPVKSQKKR